jgi:hypothetical protein
MFSCGSLGSSQPVKCLLLKSVVVKTREIPGLLASRIASRPELTSHSKRVLHCCFHQL